MSLQCVKSVATTVLNTCHRKIYLIIMNSVISFCFCIYLISPSHVFVNGLPAKYALPLSLPYLSREDWGAEPRNVTRPLTTPTAYVVIHHTYIPGACNTTDECSAAMRSMQRYHNSLGWGDIGYNFCVGSDGAAYEGRGWDAVGIHAGPANNFSIGICLIGDWSEELPPPHQLERTKALISTGVELGIIKKGYKLVGHRQAMATECPGEALMRHISTWEHFVPEFKKNIS